MRGGGPGGSGCCPLLHGLVQHSGKAGAGRRQNDAASLKPKTGWPLHVPNHASTHLGIGHSADRLNWKFDLPSCKRLRITSGVGGTDGWTHQGHQP